MKIPDVVEVEDKDGEITLLRPTPMQCDSHVKELVANQVSVRVSWDLLGPLRRYTGRGGEEDGKPFSTLCSFHV